MSMEQQQESTDPTCVMGRDGAFEEVDTGALAGTVRARTRKP